MNVAKLLENLRLAGKRQITQAGFVLGDVEQGVVAVRKMGQSGDPKHIPLLIECLDLHHHNVIRAEAANALASLKSTEATFALMEMLEDPAEMIQEAAAKALGAIGDERAIVTLVSLLKHPTDEVKRHAGEAVVRLSDKSINWVGELLKKSSFDTRIAAAYTLGHITHEKSFFRLEEAMGDADSAVRRELANALAKQSRKFASRLAAHLSDKNELVRETAIMALLKLRDPDLVPILLERLPLETNPTIYDLIWDTLALSRYEPAARRSMAKKAVKFGDYNKAASAGVEAVDVFLETYRTGDRDTRKNVVEALHKIGQSAGPVLYLALADRSHDVRRLASQLLYAMGALPTSELDGLRLKIAAGKYDEAAIPAAIPILKSMLFDENIGDREMAVDTLGKIIQPASLEALSIAARDKEFTLRERTAKILNNFPIEQSLPLLRNLAADLHFIVSAAANAVLRAHGKL